MRMWFCTRARGRCRRMPRATSCRPRGWPARAAKLPQIKDAVLAYGFPTGGNSLSITKGIVSRIEFVPYNYPVSGLRIQIDAAINPGISGGPAIAGEKMVRLAFSKLGGDTQN